MIKKCMICSKRFDGHGNARTCSRVCQTEKNAKNSREYYLANREAFRERTNKRYAANREAILEYVSEYQRNHREACREYKRKYAMKNREAILERARKYRETNGRKEYEREYRAANWEAIHKYQHEWCLKNRDACLERSRKGYARREAALAAWRELFGQKPNDRSKASVYAKILETELGVTFP